MNDAGNPSLATAVNSRPECGNLIGDDSGQYEHVAVQFVDVTADVHENLDFGLAGSVQNDLIVEPDDPLPAH